MKELDRRLLIQHISKASFQTEVDRLAVVDLVNRMAINSARFWVVSGLFNDLKGTTRAQAFLDALGIDGDPNATLAQILDHAALEAQKS